ncbi:MAG: hypothetical protein GC172_11375 [Phycisphaera sp.]|nr:hypothetical protein [Phycisphaera sp.]
MDSLGPISFQMHAQRAAEAYGARRAAPRPVSSVSPVSSASPAPRVGGDGFAPARGAAPARGSVAADGRIEAPVARPATREERAALVARKPSGERTVGGVPASAEEVAKLVSGAVDSPVSRGQGFDSAAPMQPVATRQTTAGNFALYTRAADRLEVATSVALGRTFDARG